MQRLGFLVLREDFLLAGLRLVVEPEQILLGFVADGAESGHAADVLLFVLGKRVEPGASRHREGPRGRTDRRRGRNFDGGSRRFGGGNRLLRESGSREKGEEGKDAFHGWIFGLLKCLVYGWTTR